MTGTDDHGEVSSILEAKLRELRHNYTSELSELLEEIKADTESTRKELDMVHIEELEKELGV